MTVHLPKHDQPEPLVGILESRGQLAGVVSKVPDLLAIASELFPGDVEVETELDPEISGSEYFVFNVFAPGEIKEIAGRRREWHHRTASLLKDDCSKVRLSIAVVQ